MKKATFGDRFKAKMEASAAKHEAAIEHHQKARDDATSVNGT